MNTISQTLSWLPETFIRFWDVCVHYPLGALALLVAVVIGAVLS
jgi:hypothetical protein